MQTCPSHPTAGGGGPVITVIANIKPMFFSLMFKALCVQTSRHLPMVFCCYSFQCPGLPSRSSNSNAYRGQTGNFGQGKWTGLRGEVCYSASQWLLHFWNLRLQSLCSSTPSLIVYLLALEMNCAFFKDAVQASAGGPDRTRLRAGCGPLGASLQPPHLARLYLSRFLV